MSNFDQFSDQSFRLLRERWSDPSRLAEELYSMLSSQAGPAQPADGPAPISAVSPEAQRRLATQQEEAAKQAYVASQKKPDSRDRGLSPETPWVTPSAYVPSEPAPRGQDQPAIPASTPDGIAKKPEVERRQPERSSAPVSSIDAYTEAVRQSSARAKKQTEDPEHLVFGQATAGPGAASSARPRSSVKSISSGGIGFIGMTAARGAVNGGGDNSVLAYPRTAGTTEVNPAFAPSVVDPFTSAPKSYSLTIPVTDFNSPSLLPASGGGTNSYQGTVVSCSGTVNCQAASGGVAVSALVQLYSNGPNQPADTIGPNNEYGGKVTVGMLGLAIGQVIVAGTWIMGIVKVSYGTGPTIEYWSSVPVWS